MSWFSGTPQQKYAFSHVQTSVEGCFNKQLGGCWLWFIKAHLSKDLPFCFHGLWASEKGRMEPMRFPANTAGGGGGSQNIWGKKTL